MICLSQCHFIHQRSYTDLNGGSQTSVTGGNALQTAEKKNRLETNWGRG